MKTKLILFLFLTINLGVPLGFIPINEASAQEFTNSTGTYFDFNNGTVNHLTFANGTAVPQIVIPDPATPPDFAQLSEPPFTVSYDMEQFPDQALNIIDNGDTITIENKGVSSVYNKDTCSLSLFNPNEIETEFAKESWSVHSAIWGSDNWNGLPVNSEVCETGFSNTQHTATIDAVRQNDDGIFRVQYSFDLYSIKTTVYYTNYNENTFGGINNDGSVWYGNPTKFGFVNSFSSMQTDVSDLQDGFTQSGTDFVINEQYDIEYKFLDSTRLLWGINNNVDNIYIDFKKVSKPTQYGQSQVIDPHLTAHPSSPTNLDADQTEVLKIDLDWDAGSTSSTSSHTNDDFTASGTSFGNTGGREGLAQQIQANHILIDKDVTQLSFGLEKGTNDVTGCVYAHIRESDGTNKATSSNCHESSNFSSANSNVFDYYDFTFSSTTIETDDLLTVEVDTGSPDRSVVAGNISTDQESNSNMFNTFSDPSTNNWTSIGNNDMKYKAQYSVDLDDPTGYRVYESETTIGFDDVVWENADGGTISADGKTFTSSSAYPDNYVSTGSGTTCVVGDAVCSLEVDVGTVSSNQVHWFGFDTQQTPNNYSNPNHTFCSTDFLIWAEIGTGNNRYEAYENTSSSCAAPANTGSNSVANNDVIRIDVETNGTVKYYKNNSLFHTASNSYSSEDVLYIIGGTKGDTSTNNQIPSIEGGTIKFSPSTIETNTVLVSDTGDTDTEYQVTQTYKEVAGSGHTFPNDIDDLYAWFDETTITDDGTYISKWANKEGSTNLDLLQSSQSDQPTTATYNGIAVVDLAGEAFLQTDDAYSNVPSVPQPITYFIVTDIPESTGERWLLDRGEGWGTNYDDSRQNISKSGDSAWANDGASTSMSSSEMGWQISTTVFDGANGEWRIGGVDQGSQNTGARQMSFGTLGGIGDGSVGGSSPNGQFWDEQVAEFIMYDRGLTTTEIEAIEEYLTDKWFGTSGGGDVYPPTTAKEDFDSGDIDEEFTYKVSALNEATSSGNAWDFSGARVDTSHQLLPTSGDYTYSTWVSFDNLSANQEVLRSDGGNFEIWYSNSGTGLYYRGSGSQEIEDTPNLSTGTWYNIVLVHSSSGDKVYLNAVEKSTSTIASVPTQTTWYLGGRSNGSESLDGKVDQTIVWSGIALSSTEVSSLYSGTTALPQSSYITTHYDFEQSAGGTLEDQQGSNDATPSGSGSLNDSTGIIDVTTTYESDLSSSTSWTLQDDLPAPTNLTAQSGIPIQLDWDDVANAVTYQVYRDSGSGFTLLANAGSDSDYDDSSVNAGTSYDYKVSALGPSPANLLESALSSQVTATAGQPPDAITTVTATISNAQTDPHVVTLTWGEPSDWQTGTPQSYEVFESVGSSGNMQSVSSALTYVAGTFTHTHNISGIQPLTDYYYMVRATSTHGTSADSNTPSVTTVDVPVKPDTPVAVQPDTTATPYLVNLSWSDNGDGGSDIKGHQIDRWDSNSNAWTTIETDTGSVATTYQDTSIVSPAIDVKYRIGVINGVGISTLSDESNTVTIPNTPLVPNNVSCTTDSSTQITVTWEVPSSDGGSALTYYNVYQPHPSNQVQYATNVYTHVATGLTQGTLYQFDVSAQNNVGDGSYASCTATTSIAPAGTFSITQDWIVYDTMEVSYLAVISAGNPSPTVEDIKIKLDGTTVATVPIGSQVSIGQQLTGTLQIKLPDLVQHDLTADMLMTNTGNEVTVTSNTLSVIATFLPTYKPVVEGTGEVAWQLSRDEAQTSLNIEIFKDTAPFDVNCALLEPQEASEIVDRKITSMPSGIIWQNATSVGYHNATSTVNGNLSYYVFCYEKTNPYLLMFSDTSYTTLGSALASGLSGIQDSLGPLLGGPLIGIFVLMLAGQATGRTAPTFIIITIVAVGILMGLGFFIIDEYIWGLILIMGCLGVLVGKKFL